MAFPPASLNTPLNTRRTVTDADWEKTIGDLVYNSTPTLAHFNMYKKPYRGGYSINLPVRYAKRNYAEAYSGLQPVNYTQKETITAAQFPIAHYRSPFAIADTDTEENRGPAARIDLKKEMADAVVEDMKYKLTS